uniref:Uncharacterized protein n=1 Tax=Moniliophthora roreri TaxID=221103 RepID=A0A0W0G8J2_MONRR
MSAATATAPVEDESLGALSQLLLECFRRIHQNFCIKLHESYENPEPYLLQLLDEDLQEFAQITDQYPWVFENPSEWEMLCINLQTMLSDLRALHEQAIASTHQGHMPIVH